MVKRLKKLSVASAKVVMFAIVHILCMNCAARAEYETDKASNVIGFAIGTPGGANLVYSYVGKNGVGFKITGGAISDDDGDYFAGVQIGILKRDILKESTRGHYSFVIGVFGFKDDRFTYAGFAHDFKWKPLYAEIGTIAGYHEGFTAGFIIQLGFAFEL